MIICPRERFAGAFLLYFSNDAQKNYLHCPDRLDGELVRGPAGPAHPGYYALGIKGQVLYVNPDLDLIMVRLGLTTAEPAFIPELFEELANVWPE